MKKFFSILSLLTLLGLFLNSCNRDNEIVEPSANHEQLISKFKQKLKTDKSFANFTKSYLNSSIITAEVEINKKLAKIGQKTTNLIGKTAQEKTREAVVNTTSEMILFYDQNPDFDLLSDFEKELVINDVLQQALLNVNSGISKNANITFKSNSIESLVSNYKADLEELNAKLPNINGKKMLTWGEVGGCVVGAAATYVGDNWSLCKGLWGLLQGESLTFGIVRSAVLLFFPEAKMAATVASLAGCLIGAYFFN